METTEIRLPETADSFRAWLAERPANETYAVRQMYECPLSWFLRDLGAELACVAFCDYTVDDSDELSLPDWAHQFQLDASSLVKGAHGTVSVKRLLGLL